ncbi:hypothetical protein GW17_00056085 [Ensete ventricosum]|nr:hypothetical protein GW17_00056085 [Ensete ventricosum]
MLWVAVYTYDFVETDALDLGLRATTRAGEGERQPVEDDGWGCCGNSLGWGHHHHHHHHHLCAHRNRLTAAVCGGSSTKSSVKNRGKQQRVWSSAALVWVSTSDGRGRWTSLRDRSVKEKRQIWFGIVRLDAQAQAAAEAGLSWSRLPPRRIRRCGSKEVTWLLQLPGFNDANRTKAADTAAMGKRKKTRELRGRVESEQRLERRQKMGGKRGPERERESNVAFTSV